MKDSGYSRRDQWTAWSFVGVQAILLLAVLLLPRNSDWTPNEPSRMIGGVLFVGGIAIGVWSFLYLGRGLTPSPLPNDAGKLVIKGPYALMRHPMYTGVMVMCAGIAVRSGSAPVIGTTLGLVLLFAVKARWEEKHLVARYPGYGAYMGATGRFVPLIGRST